jgi:hypothetical protein
VPLPQFAAATGLHPAEWQALERRNVDRRGGVLTARQAVSGGEVVEPAAANPADEKPGRAPGFFLSAGCSP